MANLKIGKGVAITVKNEFDAAVSVLDDGYMGVLKPCMLLITVIIDLSARLRGQFFGLEVDGKKNVVLKRDYTQGKETRVYKRNIRLREGDNGTYAPYPENHFKLLELYKNGHFRIWEIAITKRGGVFYLSTQAVWDEWAYRENHSIVLPSMRQGWPSLRQVLYMTKEEWDAKDDRRAALAKQTGKPAPRKLDRQNLLNLSDLEPVTKYKPNEPITAEGLSGCQGRVIWWNEANGLGAMATTKGVARFHRKNLAICHKWITFEKGEIATFVRLDEIDSNGEEVKTTFKLEAISVKAVPGTKPSEGLPIEEALVGALREMCSAK